MHTKLDSLLMNGKFKFPEYFANLGTIENNALVLPHFTSTPSNRKISTPLLRPYAQTAFKVYAKVRKSVQFENFAFLCHQN